MRTVPDGRPPADARKRSRNTGGSRYSRKSARHAKSLYRNRKQQAGRDRTSNATGRRISAHRNRTAAGALSAGRRKTADRSDHRPRGTVRRASDRRRSRRTERGHRIRRLRSGTEKQAADRTDRHRDRPLPGSAVEPAGQDRHPDRLADRILRRFSGRRRQSGRRRADDGPRHR